MIESRTAVDHIGLTVPDLDQAIAFFVELFGCEVVYTAGPYDNVGYIWTGEDEPEPARVRLAVLTHNRSHNFELLEYRSDTTPDRSEPPRPSSPGGAHIAFYVEDIEGTVERLKSHPDIHFLGALEREVGGPIHGLDWVYVRTPWGLVIELLHWRHGLPYEEKTTARLVPPPWL
ncbi:VOC family protein [Nocardia rhamnosiphila]|uniref:VOC family protein n=1 Tax=Nocardia rhamnosiphila TaxID=426716 RepID=A0ABV2WRN5_9NOCA